MRKTKRKARREAWRQGQAAQALAQCGAAPLFPQGAQAGQRPVKALTAQAGCEEEPAHF